MKKTKTLLALSLVLAILLALCACGGGGSEATKAPDSGEKPAEAPTPGEAPSGEEGNSLLRVGLDGEPAKLDYADPGGNIGSMFVCYSLYSPLWQFTTDGEFHYLLATSHEYNEDGTAIIVKIRENAKFSNGDPVTAKDVLFSFKSADEVNGMRTQSVDFANSKVIDDTTVQIGVKQKSPTQRRDGKRLKWNRIICSLNTPKN